MKLKVKNIKLLIAEKQQTLRGVATKIEMSPAGVRAALKRGTTTPVTAGKIAVALGVPITEIVEV